MKCSIIGTGIMGTGIANNFLDRGYTLDVYNRTPGQSEPLVARGAKFSSSPAIAAKDSEVVLVSVTDDNSAEEVWFGSQGVVHSVNEQTICIETTTVSPTFTSEWAQRMSPTGAKCLSCFVTGSKKGACEGTLTGFVGGHPTAISSAITHIFVFCSNVFIFPTRESAAEFKLLYNFIGAGIAAAFAQGLAFAEGSSISSRNALKVLEHVGWGQSVARSRGRSMLSPDRGDVSFSAANMLKDIEYAAQHFQGASKSGLLSEVSSIYEKISAIDPESDAFSSILQLFLKYSNFDHIIEN